MAQQVLSITQLNEYIRGKLDADSLLNGVAVRGEISNYKLYPSGHHYFTLKDESSALKCVMFKGNAARLRFRPANGMQIIAMGKVSVFPRDGAYQLYCTAMAMDGIGDLYAAFEQLKAQHTLLFHAGFRGFCSFDVVFIHRPAGKHLALRSQSGNAFQVQHFAKGLAGFNRRHAETLYCRSCRADRQRAGIRQADPAFGAAYQFPGR